MTETLALRGYQTAFGAQVVASTAYGFMNPGSYAIFLQELTELGVPDLVADPKPETVIAELRA